MLIKGAIILDLHYVSNIAPIPSVIEDCRNYQNKARFPHFAYPNEYLVHQHLNLRYYSHFNTPPCWLGNIKILRIKILLNYGIRIRFASCCSCTLVVTPFGVFGNCLTFFCIFFYFFCWDFLSTSCMDEVNSMTFHNMVMMFQFFQLTLRDFIIAYNFCDSCHAADQRAEDFQ